MIAQQPELSSKADKLQPRVTPRCHSSNSLCLSLNAVLKNPIYVAAMKGEISNRAQPGCQRVYFSSKIGHFYKKVFWDRLVRSGQPRGAALLAALCWRECFQPQRLLFAVQELAQILVIQDSKERGSSE